MPTFGALSSFPLTMYPAGEKYLNTSTPYTAETIKIADVTETINLRSNIPSKMTNFTGKCLNLACLPMFSKKPKDQIIRLNIK